MRGWLAAKGFRLSMGVGSDTEKARKNRPLWGGILCSDGVSDVLRPFRHCLVIIVSHSVIEGLLLFVDSDIHCFPHFLAPCKVHPIINITVPAITVLGWVRTMINRINVPISPPPHSIIHPYRLSCSPHHSHGLSSSSDSSRVKT